MATVIDSLIVKLGLDSKDFEKGEKRVASTLDDTRNQAERTGKTIAASGKKGAEFFGQLEKAALKFFAVLTLGRGLSDFTRTVIGAGAQLDRMAGRLGTSAETLSRWQGAVRQSGGTAEGFLGTMQGLSSSLTELKLTGNTGILPYLQALGVSIVKADGKAKPLEELLGDIGDKLNALPNKADAYNIGRNLGIDEGTINLLLKGRAEVDRLLASQKAYSSAEAEAARKAQENWEGVQLRIERTTQAIIIKLIPAFEKLTTKIEKLAETSVPFLSTIYDWMDKIDSVTEKWTNKLDKLIPKFNNPTLQKLFGGTPGTLLRLNPGGSAAAAGQAVANEAGGEARATALHAIDTVMAFFGNRKAQDLLNNPQGSISGTRTGAARGRTRAERNNNPGNLEFRGQSGAVPEDGSGRFAKFESAAAGVSALARQLQLYGSRGLDSVSKIISKYAPANENNTQAYIANLSKRLGVGSNQSLDLNDPNTLAGLVRGISKIESGKDYLSDTDVLTGLRMAGVNGGSSQGGSITIGEVKVYTQATDATGIARDMKGALVRQADTGMR